MTIFHAQMMAWFALGFLAAVLLLTEARGWGELARPDLGAQVLFDAGF
jgi:hypothetical protein